MPTVRVAGLGLVPVIVRSAIELRPRLPMFSGFLPSDSAFDSPITSTPAVFAARSTPMLARVIEVEIDVVGPVGRTWTSFRPPELLTAPVLPFGAIVPPLIGEVNVVPLAVVGLI